MRRAFSVLVVLGSLLIAPHAAAGCADATPTTGAAPLAVTFTTCDATAHWDFGDGTSAEGQTVQHTYAAGLWIAGAAGGEFQIVSEAVTLRMPRLVGFRHRLTFHGAGVPAMPNQLILLLAGEKFFAWAITRPDGTFRATRRISTPGPYVAHWDAAQSAALSTTVRPRLTVRLRGSGMVGQPLAIIASLAPANAGVVHFRVWRGSTLLVDRNATRVRLGTRTAAAYRISVTTASAAGFTARSEALSAVVSQPRLQRGSHGPSVRALERRLWDLRYALLRVDGFYGQDTFDAVIAFQKVNGLPRTGAAGVALWRVLARASVPRARSGGDHVEVDKTRQVLFEVRRGKVDLVVPVSTGATGNTPVGLWHVYSRVAGWSWVLWYPTYFLRGFAIHGYPDVPPYPASHGCVRAPMWVATRLYAMDPYGFPIRIYA